MSLDKEFLRDLLNAFVSRGGVAYTTQYMSCACVWQIVKELSFLINGMYNAMCP